MIDEERRQLQLVIQKNQETYRRNMEKFNQLEKDYIKSKAELDQAFLDLTMKYQQ
jgi:hypothetical protein